MSQAAYVALQAPPKRTFLKHKICIGVSIFCTVTLIGLAIAFPFIIASLLDSQAKSGIIMTRDNEGLWAHIPGDTQSITYRNFTFFNFTNAREALYLGQTPIFRQISGYSYIEYQDFNNIQYVDDDNEAKFNSWLHFEKSSTTRDVNEKVKVINLAPLGFWYQLKTADLPTFAIQGFGQLTFALRDTFKIAVLGQGVSQQFMPTFQNFVPLAQSADLTPQVTSFMWNDTQYGLGDPNNYQIWVTASRNRTAPDYKILINYFGIEPVQMQVILNQLEGWLKGLEGIINNWYCGNNSMVECESEYLTFLQLSQSGVTANPPPGTNSTDSICEQNVTCVGWPEISSYLKHVFPKQFPMEKECFNLTFSIDSMSKWMMPTKEPYCLLHAGNMNYLWQRGRLFDSTNDTQLLRDIMQRFQLKNLNHTFVFWNWVKYITKQFVLKESKKGAQAVAGIGGVASQAFYGAFSAVQDWLGDLLLTAKLSAKLSKQYVACNSFIRQIISNVTQDHVTFLCQDVDFGNATSLLDLVNICEHKFGLQWIQLQSNANLTNSQMLQLCDSTNPSLQSLINLSHMQLAQYYNCTLGSDKRCSNYELTIKQWLNSQITKKPIPELKIENATTVNAWNSDIPQFEYSWFLEFIGSNSTFRPNLTNIAELVSFDCLFSGPVIQEIMLELNDTAFEQTYNWSEPALLRSYLKFITIEVGLGGIVQERSVQDLVFGYEDDFLKNLRDMDPATGGDPSINIVVALNELNLTEDQAQMYPQSMYTGKDDFNKTRYYKTINGKQYINFNYSYWNGDQVVNDTKSPWAINDHFIGTDAFQSAPGLKPDKDSNNISIYISSLYRYGQGFYDETISKFDMDVYVARVDPSLYMNQYDNPENAKYYMEYSCFLNISSINGAPLFVSKNHFYECPSNWSNFVSVYDEAQSFIYQPSIHDDTYLQIEPFTGTTFGATIYLQTNYLFQMDELFERNQTMMLPIFSLWRSGNISDNAVDKYFGPIKDALKMKKYSIFIGMALAGVSLLIGLAVYLRMKKLRKQQISKEGEKKLPELMISLQPNTAIKQSGEQLEEQPKQQPREQPKEQPGEQLREQSGQQPGEQPPPLTEAINMQNNV